MSRIAQGGSGARLSLRLGRILSILVSVAVGIWGGTLLWPNIESQLDRSGREVANLPVPQAIPEPVAPIIIKPPGVEAFESRDALPLMLASTSPGRNAREGSAQIGVSPQSVQTYAAGALLPNGARLTEIFSDHVTLQKGRTIAVLRLAASRPSVAAGASEEPQTLESKETLELLRVGGSGARGEEVRAASPPPLASILRSQPVFENGVLRGVQVDPGISTEQFEALGLRAGDVLVALDGEPIRDASDVQQRLLALNASSPVVAMLERDGNLQSISLDGGVIATAKTASAGMSANSDTQGHSAGN